MGYHLGVDLGTTYTAAALAKGGQVDMVPLGLNDVAIPSVVWVRDDGSTLVGDVAAEKGLSEPDGLIRHFKRRLGDPVPITIRGQARPAHTLSGDLLRWVVERVTEEQGSPPSGVTLCHPANWGAYKRQLLSEVATEIGVDEPRLISEPAAAAIHYAASERLDEGAILAVYDLGGGTFDAAVLRHHGSQWEIIGEPTGIEKLGGIDFDRAVLDFVEEHTDTDFEALDHGDPMTLAAFASLRERCERAKVVLSSDTDAVITVWLPGEQRQLRLARGEFEAIIRPHLADTVEALQRALESASVAPDDVAKILLVGGSSRIPLVGQMLSANLGRPVAVDAHPKRAIALGAALDASLAAGTDASISKREELRPMPPAPPQDDAAESGVDPKTEIRQPQPSQPDSGATIRPESSPLVQGVWCPDGHFNDPRRHDCAWCGAPVIGKEVPGIRPLLGTLVSTDTGQSVAIERDAVIGRKAKQNGPETHELVRTGNADPIPVPDSTRTMNRIHAALFVDGWEVKIADLGSTNGTFVATPSGDWVPVHSDEPAVLTHGTHVLLAQTQFLFTLPDPG